jgi:hypothetical protein
MESANLNSPDPLDQKLAALLAPVATSAALPDAGFSARVLAALPPRRKTVLRRWPREWITGLLAAGVVVSLKGWQVGSGGTGLAPSLSQALTQLAGALQSPDVLIALTVLAASLSLAATDSDFAAEPPDQSGL